MTNKQIPQQSIIATFDVTQNNLWAMKKHLEREDSEQHETEIKEFAQDFYSNVNA